MTAEQRQRALENAVVTLRGKSENHQYVFAVLRPHSHRILKRFLNIRKKMDGLQGNHYFFATRGSKKSHLVGSKCIEWVATQLNLRYFNMGNIRTVAATAAVFESDPRKRKL